MTSLVSSPPVPSELDDEVTMPISLSDTYGLTYASSLRALTTASPGNYEATFSFICKSKMHIGPYQRHLPHVVQSR